MFNEQLSVVKRQIDKVLFTRLNVYFWPNYYSDLFVFIKCKILIDQTKATNLLILYSKHS